MVSARVFSILAGFTLLTACTFDPEQTFNDTVSNIDTAVGTSFSGPAAMSGLVVGDEPFAIKAGASVLADGGSAADAVTAMYFALSVTYPVAASLGGGGICIAQDSQSGTTREFDFLARDANRGGAYAVPGNVRGFSALQSTFGKLSWRRTLAPAEGLAAAGFPISRALAVRLNAAKDVIRLDADLAAEFIDESGDVKSAGEVVYNRALAETLAAIRIGGANAFYGGATASALVSYAASQGGTISLDELRGYQPQLGSPRVFRVGNHTAFVPTARVGAGAFAGIMIDNLSKAATADANLETAASVAVKAALESFGVTTLPNDMGSTGFAAADANGQAVACAVTMNGAFGSGHNAAGTGVTLARAPASGQAGLAAAFLTPVLATDSNGAIAMSGAAAGGPNGTAAITYALFRLANGAPLTRPGDLRTTGVAPFEMVNAIVCQGGTCAALPDPGGSGVGISADSVK